MSAILELPEVRARMARWSVDEYERLTQQGALRKDVELLRGLIVQKMAKSPLHRALTKRFYDHVHRQAPPGCTVYFEAPLRLADSEPEPDVAVVKGTASDFETRHPSTAELVIEVAVSSAVLDRENAQLYAEAGVREYWIVLGNQQQVEVFSLPANGVYVQRQLHGADELLACESVPSVRVPLREMFGPARRD